MTFGGVDQPHKLIQKVTLVENCYIRSPLMLITPRTQVRFYIGLDDTNTAQCVNTSKLHQATSGIKSMIGSLSQQIQKINLSTQQPRSHSPTPYSNMIHHSNRYRDNNAAACRQDI